MQISTEDTTENLEQADQRSKGQQTTLPFRFSFFLIIVMPTMTFPLVLNLLEVLCEVDSGRKDPEFHNIGSDNQVSLSPSVRTLWDRQTAQDQVFPNSSTNTSLGVNHASFFLF